MKKLEITSLWNEQPSNGWGFILFGFGFIGEQFQIVFFNFLVQY